MNTEKVREPCQEGRTRFEGRENGPATGIGGRGRGGLVWGSVARKGGHPDATAIENRDPRSRMEQQVAS